MLANYVFILTNMFLTVLSVLLIMFTVFTIYIYYIRRQYRHIPTLPFSQTPPILKTNFWLMHLPWVSDRTRKAEFFTLDQATFNHSSIYAVFFLHRCIVMVLRLDEVKRVLMQHNHLPKSETFKDIKVFGQNMLSNGIFAIINQSEWKVHRHHMNHAFAKQNLEQYAEKFNLEAQRLCQKLCRLYAGRGDQSCHSFSDYLSMAQFLKLTSFNLIAECGFGWKVQQLDESLDAKHMREKDILPYEFYELFEFCATTLLLDLERKFDRFNPFNWKARSKGREKARKLRNYIREKILAKRRQSLLKEQTKKHIFDYICELGDKGANLERLVDEVFTFMGGGYETVSTMMCFALMELSRRPHFVDKCLLEMDEVIGQQTLITSQMIGKLSHLNAFIKEISRFYTIAPYSLRHHLSNCNHGKTTASSVTCTFELCGKKIPSNTIICIPFASLHRNLYERGHEFIEDRFLYKEDANSANDCDAQKFRELFVFSYGPRNCIGRSFAKMEMPIVLAHLLRTFQFQSQYFQEQNISNDLKTTEQSNEIKMVSKFLSEPIGDTVMRLRPRLRTSK